MEHNSITCETVELLGSTKCNSVTVQTANDCSILLELKQVINNIEYINRSPLCTNTFFTVVRNTEFTVYIYIIIKSCTGTFSAVL